MWWHTHRNQISSFGRNGRVYLNRRGGVSSVDYWPAEVCTSAVVMLDTPCSEVVWRVLATHCIRQFPLNFPSRASPCAITFQLDSTSYALTCCVPQVKLVTGEGWGASDPHTVFNICLFVSLWDVTFSFIQLSKQKSYSQNKLWEYNHRLSP